MFGFGRNNGAAPQPPRHVSQWRHHPLLIAVRVWGQSLRNDYGSEIDPSTKKKRVEVWKKLWDHPIGTSSFEIMSLLEPTDRVLPTGKALAELPPADHCAPQRIAEALTFGHLRDVVPVLLAGRPEARIHFFGTAWQDAKGFTRVPRIKVLPNRIEPIEMIHVDHEDAKHGVSDVSIWTHSDFVVLLF